MRLDKNSWRVPGSRHRRAPADHDRRLRVTRRALSRRLLEIAERSANAFVFIPPGFGIRATRPQLPHYVERPNLHFASMLIAPIVGWFT
jgi:hypothetical protein